MSDKPYFDGVKVGDRVYDLAHGWGTVAEYHSGKTYSIHVEFEWGTIIFTNDGRIVRDANQTLFWDKPEFTPPPRPKRKVKKLVERRMNVHHVDGKTSFSRGCDTKEEADAFEEANIHNGRNRRIACVKLTGEYEVEE